MPDKVNVTYDIRCICSPSVDTRFDNYGFATLGNRGVSSAVPMFHLNAHRKYCRSVVSPHLLPQWSWTNSEGVERGWSWMKPFAWFTKEMGPDSRHDLLDDMFGHWNWNKVITMRTWQVFHLHYHTDCTSSRDVTLPDQARPPQPRDSRLRV